MPAKEDTHLPPGAAVRAPFPCASTASFETACRLLKPGFQSDSDRQAGDRFSYELPIQNPFAHLGCFVPSLLVKNSLYIKVINPSVHNTNIIQANVD